jgi:hypothetical protein
MEKIMVPVSYADILQAISKFPKKDLEYLLREIQKLARTEGRLPPSLLKPRNSTCCRAWSPLAVILWRILREFMTKAILDSSFLFALIDEKDKWRNTAVLIQKALKKKSFDQDFDEVEGIERIGKP